MKRTQGIATVLPFKPKPQEPPLSTQAHMKKQRQEIIDLLYVNKTTYTEGDLDRVIAILQGSAKGGKP
jgi:hypothetical protein